MHANLTEVNVILFSTDVDECTSGNHNCDVHASCTNTRGSHTCTCHVGFLGDGTTCAGDVFLDVELKAELRRRS